MKKRTDQAASLRALTDGNVHSIERPRRRVVAVTGGKGGIGKSTLALNLALAWAKRGARTLAVDGDAGMADLNLLLGVVPGATFGHQTLALSPGDVLVLYTDGMIEARGADGLFGLARLERIAVDLVGRSAQSVTDALVAAVSAYDEMRTHDDLAVLTMRRT